MNASEFFSKLLQFAIGPLGAAIIGFITVPITTWLVNPEQFGLTTMFTLLQTLITSFIYLGLDQAYVREYNNKQLDKNKLLFNATLIPVVISFIVSITVALFSDSVSIYLFNEVNDLLMYCLVVWIPFVVIERFLLLNIRMQEKGLQYSIYNIVTKLFVMLLTIGLLLLFERTYTSIILGTMVGQIITCIILIIISYKELRIEGNILDWILIKRMIRFGLPILPSVIIVWLLNSCDRIVLSYFTTINEIGIYFAAMKLVAALNMIQTIFATFWVPMAYRWHEENVEKEYFEKVSYGLGIFMGIVFIGILFFKKILILIFSPEYSTAQYILPFLLFNPIMYTMSETTTLGISFSRKTHFNIWISMISAIVNIIINILLVPFIGGVGAAIGTGLAYVTFFWARTLISRKYWYKFNLKFYILNIGYLLIVATINVLIKNQNIYLVNFILLCIFIFINIPFLNKIINLNTFVSNLSLRLKKVNN